MQKWHKGRRVDKRVKCNPPRVGNWAGGFRGNVVAKGPPVPVEAMAASSAVQARPAAAAVPSAAKDYDPVPDLIRMQGVFSGPSPAPYDPVVVIVRRGGGLEFMDAARSFRCVPCQSSKGGGGWGSVGMMRRKGCRLS
jgi:hypothetical protein